jgi:hypothetical protein
LIALDAFAGLDVTFTLSYLFDPRAGRIGELIPIEEPQNGNCPE